MTTFLFPGQGSQKVGMGAQLFERYPRLVQQADQVLGYSIKNLCLKDPLQQLNQTQYTQPALYTVNALSYLNKKQQPAFAVGHSLGEYNALFAAGVFDFVTGLQLVKYRGELMQQATGGAMAAVIGLAERPLRALMSAGGFTTIDLANVNEANQVVISGPQQEIAKVMPYLEEHGAKLVIPLKVSGAFHSRYMQPFQDKFHQFLNHFTFQAPRLTVLANINAQAYTTHIIVDNLVQQITHPVRWFDTLQALIAQGETDFHEVGSGTVLTGMVNRLRPADKVAS